LTKQVFSKGFAALLPAFIKEHTAADLIFALPNLISRGHNDVQRGGLGDLAAELAPERSPEAAEIFSRHNKGAGATDDRIAIVVLYVAGRRDAAVCRDIPDGDAVDGDALGDRSIAGLLDG
jgi:hypothetical protein